MLNQEGINKLEAIMLANGKYFYNQRRFGQVTECGTELCAAGFAHLMEVGKRKFNRQANEATQAAYFPVKFSMACTTAGINLLGLTCDPLTETSDLPPIFDTPRAWPYDLEHAYYEAHSNAERIAIYINMLRTRVNDDGTIREAEEEAA